MNPKAIALQQRTHRFFDRSYSTPRGAPTATTGARAVAGLITSSSRKSPWPRKSGQSKGWVEGLLDAGYGDRQVTRALIREADELTAIFVKSHKTAKKRQAAAAAAKRRK
jgi:hypothetical protein